MPGERFYLREFLGAATLSEPGIPATLYEISAQNLSGGTVWLMVFNASLTPAPGTIPEYSFRLADGDVIAIAPPGNTADGRPFDLGWLIGWNSTAVWANEAGPFGDSILYAAGRHTTL